MDKLIGNAVVGQSGGPTCAINATLAGLCRGIRENRDDGRIQTLYGMRNGIEGLLKGNLVNLTDAFPEGEEGDALLHRLASTPAAALGSCRKRLPSLDADPEGIYPALLSIFRQYNIRYFFYIGGNDSMDTVDKLSAYMKENDYRMSVIGIPKTIDNDLALTDHTPGFGSAAKYIAVTMQEILHDCAVYTKPSVTVVEIMGRDAGWLTASAGLGRIVTDFAPDYIYLPEVAFDRDAFFADLRAALARHPNVVIAVSEGIRFADGRYVCEGVDNGAADVFGHKQLSGTGKVLENAIRAELGCKSRSVEVNISQRCASHIASETDIAESLALGSAAAAEAANETCGKMMALRRLATEPYATEIFAADACQIANAVKSVPRSYINAEGNNVTDECLQYLLPLIAGEAYPTYRNGLPVYFRF